MLARITTKAVLDYPISPAGVIRDVATRAPNNWLRCRDLRCRLFLKRQSPDIAMGVIPEERRSGLNVPALPAMNRELMRWRSCCAQARRKTLANARRGSSIFSGPMANLK